MHLRGIGQTIGLVIGLIACSNATLEEPTAEIQLGLTASYVATSDTVILKSFPNLNLAGATGCGAKGDQLPSGRSCLLRFDVPLMDITVNSAWLDLRATDTTGQTFNVYKVASTWFENEATWNQRRAGVPWQVSGALGSADRGPTLGGQTFNQSDQIFFFNDSVNGGVQMVQSWFSSPSTNYGVIIADDGNDDLVVFASSEHATPEFRPTLHVNYTLNTTGGGTGSTNAAVSVGGLGL